MIDSVLLFASLGLMVVGLPWSFYLGLLAVLSWRRSRPLPDDAPVHFTFVVPAHNEELGIAGTVENLRGVVDYPQNRYDVVVVADNCSDGTAAAAESAGARVMVRHNQELRGKGYALEHAFDRLMEEGRTDAFVIVDADTQVKPNILRAFAACLGRGEICAQAEYRVANVDASWRTRLMSISMAAICEVRASARENLGVSAVLRGNGMCFSRRLLEQHRHQAYGLVEDVEFAADLALAGVRVAYAHETAVYGEMVSTAKEAVSQRKRWEGGRVQLALDKVPKLLGGYLRTFQLVKLDLAMELLIPPLSTVAAVVGLGVGVEAVRLFAGFALAGEAHVAGMLREVSGQVTLWLWLAGLASIVLYVLRGVALSGLGFFRGLWTLGWAPVFVVWKVLFARGGKKQQEWVRTTREAEKSDD